MGKNKRETRTYVSSSCTEGKHLKTIVWNSPKFHIRTALSAPTENTVEPSVEKAQSKTGDEFS
jgi:hypothetical protein